MKANLYIRKIRLEKGLSQHYMAEQMRVTAKTFARLERGEGKLTIENLIRIAEILEVSPYHLIRFRVMINNDLPKNNGNSQNIERQFNRMISHLERQLNHAVEENSKLRKILMNSLDADI